MKSYLLDFIGCFFPNTLKNLSGNTFEEIHRIRYLTLRSHTCVYGGKLIHPGSQRTFSFHNMLAATGFFPFFYFFFFFFDWNNEQELSLTFK